MAVSPLHFDTVQSQSHPCCQNLPKGTHGTYRKGALFFQEKSFWPGRSALSSFVPVKSPPKVVPKSSGSSISSRFGEVREGAQLVVLKKKQEPKQTLPYTPTLPTQDQFGAGEEWQQSLGSPPLDAAAMLAQAALLQRAIDSGRASVCGSSRSHPANTPANQAANRSANPEFAPQFAGSPAANLQAGGSRGEDSQLVDLSQEPDHSPQQEGMEEQADHTSQQGEEVVEAPESDSEGGSPDESDEAKEEQDSQRDLFPHSPKRSSDPRLSSRSRASLQEHRGPGYKPLTPVYQFSGSPLIKSESESPQDPRLQVPSQEVTLSLQPGQLTHPDTDQDPPSDPRLQKEEHWDPVPTASELGKSCGQDPDPASGKGTQVPNQKKSGKGKKQQLPSLTDAPQPSKKAKGKSGKSRGPGSQGHMGPEHTTGRGKAGDHHKTSAQAEGVVASQSNLKAKPIKIRPSQVTEGLEVIDPSPFSGPKNLLPAMDLSITVPTDLLGQAGRTVVSADQAADRHFGGLGRGRGSQVSEYPEARRSKSAPGAKASGKDGRSSRDRPARKSQAEDPNKWSFCPQLPQTQSEGLCLGVSFAGVTQHLSFVPFFQGKFTALGEHRGHPEQLRNLLCSMAADSGSKVVLVTLPPLAVQLVAHHVTQALDQFTQLTLARLPQSPAVESEEPMDTQERAPLTKKQQLRAQQKARMRELQEESRRGLPSQEAPPMTFGQRVDPYADGAGGHQTQHPPPSDLTATSQVLLEPLTQVVDEFKQSLQVDRDERRSLQRQQPPIPGTSDPLGPFDLTPPEGYEVPGIFKVMTKEQVAACQTYHQSCPTKVLPFKEGRSVSELSSHTLSSRQAQEFPDKMDDLAKEIWDRMSQDVSDNPRDWESARTPGTAPQWNLPAEQEEPEVPASYHYDLDAMVTETPVESTKTYTGIPVSNRARRVLQHVAFGKEADKSSTLSNCVHLPKSDFKTCARYSLALSAQEEQILGQKQPIKAGKLESQEKVVTALRDEMPFDKDFFADSRVVLQHQTDAMKAGLAAHAAVEASVYLAAEIQRNLEDRLTHMESEGASAQAEARGIRSAISADLDLLQKSLLYADTSALGSVDSQARAARVDQLRARIRTTRVMMRIKTDEKDSQLLQAVRDLPVIPASLFGGRFFNAVEGLASGQQRAEAASTLVSSLGRGYQLKLKLDKGKGNKRPFQAAGASGGPKSKKTKGSSDQSSGNQSAGSQAGKQQPQSKPAAGRGKQQQQQSQSTTAGRSGGRGRGHHHPGRGRGANNGSGGRGRGKSGDQQ